MYRLILGVVIFLLGGLLFLVGIYYGWISVTPGVEVPLSLKYQNLSWLFGISSYLCLASGLLLVFLSLRQMNKSSDHGDEE